MFVERLFCNHVVSKTCDTVHFEIEDKEKDTVHFDVFDYDRVSAHDFLGSTTFKIRLLENFKELEISLPLHPTGVLDLVFSFYPNTVYGSLVRKCVETNSLYKDLDFKPESSSIGEDKEFVKQVKFWERASKICEKNKVVPELFYAGIEPADIRQQGVGDCYFLAAVAVAASQPKLIKALFTPDSYSLHGIYSIRFFVNGAWKDVIVDDYIPMKAVDNPSFARSQTLNELWVTLLEKAYAKLHGSYQAIEGAHSVREALEHLTGGFGDAIALEEHRNRIKETALFFQMLDWRRRRHLMAASTSTEDDLDFEAPLIANENGIVPKHAYSVLDVRQENGHQLIRLRNTWGQTEWLGKFSDNDTKSWTNELKQKLNFVNRDDGSFWMEMGDFMKEFGHLYVCKLPVANFSTFIKGDWSIERGNAGGHLQYATTFFNNPQYQLYIPREAEYEETRVMISIQLDKSPNTNQKPNPVGLYLLLNNKSSKRLLQVPNVEDGGLISFTSLRKVFRDATEVVIKKTTQPYILIPCQWYPNTNNSFKVEVFSEKPVVLRHIPTDEDWQVKTIHGEFSGLEEYGPHYQVSTFPTNPLYLIENLDPTVENQIHLTVELSNASVPFYPYLLKQVGIDKLKKKRRALNPADCVLFPPQNVFHQSSFTFSAVLKPEDGVQYMLVLSTPFPNAKSEFKIAIKTNNFISITPYVL